MGKWIFPTDKEAVLDKAVKTKGIKKARYDAEHGIFTFEAKRKNAIGFIQSCQDDGLMPVFCYQQTVWGRLADALFNLKPESCKPENTRKEVDDGKTLSSVVGVGGEVLDTEKNGVRVDPDGEAGSEDGYLPGADPGRPGGADEGTGDVEVPVPIEPLDCLIAFEEYAKRYYIPIPTLRRWVKAGRLQLVTLVRDDLIPGYSMKYSMIKQGPLYPYKPDERRTTPWEWLPWEEYCRKRLDWASWTD